MLAIRRSVICQFPNQKCNFEHYQFVIKLVAQNVIIMRFPILRLLGTSNVPRIVARLKSEAPVYWEAIKTGKKEAFSKRFTSLNDWYTKFLRLDEVKLHQDRVVTLQERLLDMQDKRREIGRRLAETRKKSNQLQDEIHQVKRQEDIERFLALMKEETEVLRQEHEIARTFQECDQAERELFTAFTNSVRDSHEKQRAQLEYTKYFGIILSIAGSFLAFCYTTLRKDDLKRFIEESLSRNLVTITNPDSAGDHNDNPSTIVEIMKSETVRLGELINLNQNRVVDLIEKDKEAKQKLLIYYMGFSVLVLVLFKAMSTT